MNLEPIILGSQSPRRREILSFFSLPFDQIHSEFDEDSVPFEGKPEDFAQSIALGKAHDLTKKYPNRIILTADTVVYLEGKVYGKPKDYHEAKQFLLELVGKWHGVYTAVIIAKNEEVFKDFELTKVFFNPLNEIQIEKYLNAIQWADKAGGYAIQLAGSLLVHRIEGCYYNVMGLPMQKVAKLLKHVGMDLWDYL